MYWNPVANQRVNGLGEAQGLYLFLYTLETDWSPVVIEKVDGHAGPISKEATRLSLQVIKKTHKFRAFTYLVHGPTYL